MNVGINLDGLDMIIEFLPFIIPLVLLQFGLMIFAIIDIIKKNRTKNLSPVAWILIAALINMLGPVLYFVLGRAENNSGDDI